MLSSQEEIFQDLESTLEQLIHNEKTLCERNKLDSREQSLLCHTQESLAARFIHMKSCLEQSKKGKRFSNLEKKLQKLELLNPSLLDKFCNNSKNCPRIGRNRKKSKMSKLAYCNL